MKVFSIENEIEKQIIEGKWKVSYECSYEVLQLTIFVFLISKGKKKALFKIWDDTNHEVKDQIENIKYEILGNGKKSIKDEGGKPLP